MYCYDSDPQKNRRPTIASLFTDPKMSLPSKKLRKPSEVPKGKGTVWVERVAGCEPPCLLQLVLCRSQNNQRCLTEEVTVLLAHIYRMPMKSSEQLRFDAYCGVGYKLCPYNFLAYLCLNSLFIQIWTSGPSNRAK